MNNEVINKETKRLDLLLKIGLAMISISGLIFATSTWNIISNIVKVILLIIFGVIFFTMSYFSETKIKIKSTTMTYWILSMLFFIFTTVAISALKIFGSWFSFTGEGHNLCYFITYLTTSITSFITYKKFNNKFILGIGNIFLYLAILNILLFIPLSKTLVIALISIITLIISIICNQKNNNYTNNLSICSTIISYLFPVLTLSILDDKINDIYFVVAILSQIINLTYQALSNKDDANGLLAALTNLMLILFLIKINLSESIILPLIYMFTTIFNIICLNTKIYEKNKFFNTTNLIINTIMTMFVFGFSFTTNIYSKIIILILLLIPSIISVIKNNNTLSNLEKAISPYKYILSIVIVIALINKNLFTINISIALSIISIITGILYLLAKEKYFKITYLVLYITSLIFSFLLPSDKNIITIIINILSSILLFFMVYKTDNNNKFLPIATIIMLFSIHNNIVESDVIKLNTLVLNTIVIIMYSLFALIFNDNKKIYIPTLFLMILPLIDISNYISIDWICTILNASIALYILGLICETIIKDNDTKNIISTILTAIIILFVVFNNNIYVGIYVGIVSLLLIFISIFNQKYKSLFIVGIIYTIITIIYQLRDVWGKIPFWLYLLIAGLLIVGVVTYIQIKLSNKPPKRFCTHCGNELNNDHKFCTHCGKGYN